MLAPMLRAVRRPSAAATAAGALGVALAGALSGCAGIGQPAPYDSPGINGLVVPTPSPDPNDFVKGVDNPWLPLGEGAAWSYEVTDAGRTLGVVDVEVVQTASVVAGLAATEVLTTRDIAGERTEETRFYAQDDDGNVWLVGADVDGKSWRAGEAGAEAGLAMPADPRLGDGWLAYEVPGLPRASTTIEEQTRELVQTRDEGLAEADSLARNVYEKGVGLAGVEDLDAGWTARLAEQP
ncbi:hypothetical protein GCM10023339_22830 [Alloalcanivorax gelatiniphagus]